MKKTLILFLLPFCALAQERFLYLVADAEGNVLGVSPSSEARQSLFTKRGDTGELVFYVPATPEEFKSRQVAPEKMAAALAEAKGDVPAPPEKHEALKLIENRFMLRLWEDGILSTNETRVSETTYRTAVLTLVALTENPNIPADVINAKIGGYTALKSALDLLGGSVDDIEFHPEVGR